MRNPAKARSRIHNLALVVVTAGLILGGATSLANNSDSTSQGVQGGQDSSSAMVLLNGDPLSTYVKTKPPQGKKIDFNSSTVKSYRAQLSALRNQYKQWLHANVPQAKVTSEFDIALNAVAVQLNGATLQQISATPMVVSAQYESLYSPTAADPDLALIHATDAWAQGGGAANAGAGVKVAIIDTGIDITHPCFSDAGYPAQQQLGNKQFTNNKVIAAKVFNNRTPTQHYTPEALQDHGTHVSGTAACNFNTPATVEGVTIPYNMSGVAPKALLGNYNVFPGTDVVDARDEDIFKALETAYADGFDIANMSLGGGQKGVQDLLMAATDNLDKANMIVAIAAGNSGPGFGTVESPGAASRALTAGASSVPHFVGAPVTVGANVFAARPGDFEVVSSDLTATLTAVAGTVNGLNTACSALAAGSLTGQIALITRGGCTFSAKLRNAQAAGAAAVLVANNAIGDPIEMATDGAASQPTVPAYMVSKDDGQTLKGLSGSSATISATLMYFQTPNANIMGSFSSRGPTQVDFRIKPDVVAPGVNVLSSIPHQFCDAPPCFAFFDGTSMATPHLAGSAAVVLGQHPGWSSAEVRSAIVNTADRGVLKSSSTGAVETNVNVIGAGLENLLSAVGAQAALDPVSVSFGAVPSGSGQTQPFAVTLTNLGSATASWTLATSGGDASVAYDVTPKSVTVAAGGSVVVTVIMSAGKGAALGGHQGALDITSGGAPVAHAALYTMIK